MAFEVSYFALQYSQEDMDLNNKQWEEALEKERLKHLELDIRENQNNNQPDLDQQPQRLKELEIGKRDNANDHQQREYQCGEHTDDDYDDNQQNNEHEYDADDDQQNNENEYNADDYRGYVNYKKQNININSENSANNLILLLINKKEMKRNNKFMKKHKNAPYLIILELQLLDGMGATKMKTSMPSIIIIIINHRIPHHQIINLHHRININQQLFTLNHIQKNHHIKQQQMN